MRAIRLSVLYYRHGAMVGGVGGAGTYGNRCYGTSYRCYFHKVNGITYDGSEPVNMAAMLAIDTTQALDALAAAAVAAAIAAGMGGWSLRRTPT